MADETKHVPITAEDRQVFEDTIAAAISNPAYNQSYMYYGYMIAQCAVIFKRMEAPAAVNFYRDHFNLFINPDQFNEFPLLERLGILKHEMLHILGGHFNRLEDRDMRLFNYATDCAINQLIDKNHLPKGCIYPDNLPTTVKNVPTMLGAEQYYELLENDPDEDKLPQPGEGPGTLDDHSEWENSEGDPDLQKDITKGMLEKAGESTQKARGELPSKHGEWLEMHSRKNEVDWKRVLRGIVGNRKVSSRPTIMRSSRRFPRREDIRGKTKDRLFSLAVVGDESGSVSSDELTDAIAEIQHICDLTKAPLWYVPVDTQAHKPHLITKAQRTFERSACGGTILAPAVDMLKSEKIKYNALVVITDGYIDDSDVYAFNDEKVPVIWLITSNGEIMDIMSNGKMRAFKLSGKTS
jgi:predicted metal-dependent peptidase